MECRILRDERLDVLYGEADAATRQRVEEHLAVCEACREETAALVSVRQDLTAWSLPFGERSLRRLQRRLPSLLPLAAALVAALGTAFLLSGSEVRYDGGQLTFRLGRPAPAGEKALADQVASALLREQQLEQQVAELKASSGGEGSRDERMILARMEQMIHDSESRQAQSFQATMARLDARSEAQRRYDLARVAASLAYLDGKNGQHVARTTELMGYMLEASQKR
jgi:hypothetical protein